jgi:hypothetical protein
MTGFILREVGGWVLVAVGLWAFRESWRMLYSAWIFEAWAMVAVGFITFRGGIHLLKVAVAARVAQRAAREMDQAALRPKLPLPKALVKK